MKSKIIQLRSLLYDREHYIVLSICFVLFLSGTVYSFFLGNNLRFADENQYYDIATNLASNHAFSLDGKQPTVSRAPIYPFLLSLLISLGGNIPALRLINYIAFSSSVFLLYLIVKNQSSKLAGMISAIILLCYPVLFYAAGILITEHVAAFIFLLILFLLFKDKTISTRHSVLIGFLFGCLILTTPTFIFSLFIVTTWITFYSNKNKIKVSLIILLIAFCTIGVWTIRNYAALNAFILVSNNSGLAFYHGNFEGTTPNVTGKIDFLIPDSETKDLNEVELQAYYKSKALDFIRKNKVRSIKLYFLKVLNYFNFRTSHGDNGSKIGTFTSNYKDIVMFLTYGPILAFFITRLFFIKKYKLSQYELLFIMLYFSNAFFFAVFTTRIRYRLPFDFLLIAIVGMFIDNIYKLQIQQKRLS